MLEDPSCGWCSIKLPGHEISGASYLVDYPVELALAFLECVEDHPSKVRIDRESLGWQTLLIEPGLLRIVEYDGDPDDGMLYELPLTPAAFAELKEDLAEDIEEYFNDWVDWTAPEGRERVLRRKELSRLARRLSGKKGPTNRAVPVVRKRN